MVELNLYATPNKLDTTSINKSEVMSKCLQKRNFPIKQLRIFFQNACSKKITGVHLYQTCQEGNPIAMYNGARAADKATIGPSLQPCRPDTPLTDTAS